MNSNPEILHFYEIALNVGIVVGATLLYLWVFWLLYVLVMGLYRAWLQKRLVGLTLIMALPVVAVGYLIDLFANWVIATIVFFELPRYPLELVTDRLSRHARDTSQSWRSKLASEICVGLLDHFDPSGKHCY